MTSGELPNLTASPSAAQSREGKLQPLAEIADILDSKRVPVNSKEREKRTGKIPYYGATGQVGWIDDHLFDEELVLLGEDGAPFLEPSKPKAYIIHGKSWVNNHAHVLRARKVPARWLAHYLNTISYDGLVTGTTRLKLTQAAMRQIQIPVLSYSTMQGIVAEIEKQFSCLDEAVANLKRVKANLKRYKAAVLKAAVEGRLVPTEAELARKEGRTYETGEQLLARILQERRAAWGKQNTGSRKKRYIEPQPPETSNLPDLPEGWVWTSIDQISDRVTKGSSPNWQGFDYCESGIVFIRSQNVGWGIINLSEVAFLPTEFNQKEKKSILKTGDVLLNIVGASIGRAAIVPQKIAGGNVNQAVAVISVFDEGILNSYLLLYLLSTDAQRQIHAEKVDVARANFSLEDTRLLKLPLPPIVEQLRIVAEVNHRLSISNKLEAQIDANLKHAERLRQSVLQTTFAGSN